MHHLIFLNTANMFFEAFHIDEIIYGKLPIVESYPTGELLRVITSVMFHGLYEKINPYLLSMSNAQDGPLECTKYYLRNFLEEISIQENGYLLY